MPLLKGGPLEVGTIDYQFRNSLEAPLFRGEPQYAVRHVKWEGFDHDHGDRHKMKRMARGIIRSRFEALYELDVMDVFKPGRIVKLVNDYRKIASDYVVRYSSLSRAQGLSYDVNKEKRSVDDFANQIWKGYTDFLNQPRSNSLIPPVSEAPMDFRARETERKVPLQPEILIDPAVNQPMSAMHAYA
jgi:hypothetical protein